MGCENQNQSTQFPGNHIATIERFDTHVIGIDLDFCTHVSDPILEIHDGPFLDLGLKSIAGQVIQLPRWHDERPDRDRLAMRFEDPASAKLDVQLGGRSRTLPRSAIGGALVAVFAVET
jgi:hypothetical protein